MLRDRDDNSKPSGVRKWAQPLKLAIRYATRAPGLVQPAVRAVRAIADVAGLAVSEVDISEPSANFVIFFDENTLLGNCIAYPIWKNWALTHAEIQINHGFRGSMDNCLIHEAMHAFGFISHPHAADSVLSYVYKRPGLTPLDVNLIKTLYDPAMKLGLRGAPASALACGLLARLMSIEAGDRDAVCKDRTSTVQFPPEPERRRTTLALSAASPASCQATANYPIELSPGQVSFSYSDGWHTFKAEPDGGFAGSFTHAKNGSTYRLAGNLKTRTVKVENVNSGCAWEGPL